MNNEETISTAAGPYHHFRLCRRAERDYSSFDDLLARKDAPVSLSHDVVIYLEATLKWVRTLNPGRKCEPGNGLYLYGPTIIAPEGGECFRKICLGWAEIFVQGPDPLILTSGRVKDSVESHAPWKPYRFCTSRTELVQAMRRLAEYGEKAASGEYYVLHLGI